MQALLDWTHFPMFADTWHAPRQAFVKKFGHGKLLVDESIFPLAYATNVNEQVLEVGCKGSSCRAPFMRRARQTQPVILRSCELSSSGGCMTLLTTRCLPVCVGHKSGSTVTRPLDNHGQRPGVQVIDLQAQKRVAAYNYNASLPDPSVCTGTHALVYSTRNKQCAPLAPRSQLWAANACSVVSTHPALSAVVQRSTCSKARGRVPKEGWTPAHRYMQ